MTETTGISILIVEDEPVVAMDIARRLRKLGYEIAATKNTAQKAIDYISLNTPDLVLCDINLKGHEDGITVAQYIKTEKQIPLIFLTALSDRKTLDRAKKTLPYGYVVKPFNNRDLLTAIELALYKFSVELEKVSLTNERLTDILIEDLSKRELEILQDIVNGLTNTQISEQKFISINTVKYHISRIFQKMEAKNRAEVLHKILQLVT